MNTIPLDFSFNQAELAGLADRHSTGKIVISVCGIRKEGKTEMYLCAEAFTKSGPVMAEKVIVACPYPPGWRIEEGTQLVEHASLVYAPKFAISAATLKTNLRLNQLPTINAGGGKAVKLLTVSLEARQKSVAPKKGLPKGYQDSESVIAFKFQKMQSIRGADGKLARVAHTVKKLDAKAF